MVHKEHASPQTIAARLEHTWDEVASLADRHTCAIQLWLSTRAPEAVHFEGVGVVAGSTGLAVPLLNLALGSSYPPGTEDTTITNEIEAVKAFFAHRKVPWYWWLGPRPRPPDIAQRLERHGLALRGHLPAMVAPLPAPLPPLAPDVHVWPAADRSDLEAASTIRRLAFGFPDGVAVDYFEAMADDWLNGGGPCCLYLARLGDGPPAAIGALIMGTGLPGVYVMGTRPEWRRRGLGKAILARILAVAAADGQRLIVLTASDFGYPLYRRFGFEHIFDYAIYRP